ncbi:MAG: CDP-alcohol phosphatidyltransferase family protein [Patescibacteria group bacterium]
MSQRGYSQLYPHDYVMRYTVVPLIPQWVQPNHITLLRMLMTPFVVWVLFLGDYRLGIPLFIIAAFTDALDGSLARLRQKITPWGIFFDPVADKLLVGGVALTVAIQHFHPILVFVAIALDLLPAMVFLSRKNPSNQMMMANVWGKVKMVTQFLSLSFLLFGIFLEIPNLIVAGEVTLGVSLIFALIAAVTYSL